MIAEHKAVRFQKATPKRSPADIEAKMIEGKAIIAIANCGVAAAIVNYQTLAGKAYKNCFCTAMLFDPGEEIDEEIEIETEHLSAKAFSGTICT
ncbi:hypothetical protein [Dyadobacter sp. CY347]|uniref:hypothetical protein n=1 Tax=Dyadobacter sp. CY347 TaxID=2909336 RepID=UPI001F1DECBD|nr:hypothetical protein [Dyadobacter sp. CY347]MCF2489107.1 hypothetical protein [Dyadobacter sp. CY347]